MMKDKEALKVLKEFRTTSGAIVTFYDRSRQMAGDRLFVKLECEVRVPVPEELWESKINEEPDVLSCVKKKLGEAMVITVVRERNFVPEEDYGRVISELADNVESTIMDYADNESFSAKLFAKQYEEKIEQCIMEEHMKDLPDKSSEEDEGPADFSSCFK